MALNSPQCADVPLRNCLLAPDPYRVGSWRTYVESIITQTWVTGCDATFCQITLITLKLVLASPTRICAQGNLSLIFAEEDLATELPKANGLVR